MGKKLSKYEKVMLEARERAERLWKRRVEEGLIPFDLLEDCVKKLDMIYTQLNKLTSQQFPAIPLTVILHTLYIAKETLRREVNALKSFGNRER